MPVTLGILLTATLPTSLWVARAHGCAQQRSRRLVVAWFHHQFLPDRVEYEPGAFTPDEILALTQHGHVLAPREETYGNGDAG